MSFADDLGERRYVSQYSIETLGLVVRKNGVVADPDMDSTDVFLPEFIALFGSPLWVKVQMTSLDGSVIYFDRPATRTGVGIFETSLSSVESANPGIYKIVWSYHFDGALQIFVGLVEVGESNSAYDNLTDGFKGIVESAWLRFADLFDSPNGGPNLQTYFQSRFGRGRMAQLLQIALNRLNTISQPHMTYTLDPNLGQFPYAQWGGLLDQALYIEAIKHLRRSYVEQPLVDGVGVARLDRRDYLDRWGQILQDEEADLKNALDVFKMANMGLGKPHVLVSGGAYGNWGPTRIPGNSAARPNMWARFY